MIVYKLVPVDQMPTTSFGDLPSKSQQTHQAMAQATKKLLATELNSNTEYSVGNIATTINDQKEPVQEDTEKTLNSSDVDIVIKSIPTGLQQKSKAILIYLV